MQSETAEQLKRRLAESGTLSAGQLEAAEVYAEEKRVSLQKALVSLRYIESDALGRMLAELTGLPYIPLLATPPPTQARRLLSFICAKHWKVLPIAYEADADRLTVAVHDTEQMGRMEKIHRLFLQTHKLTFSIAPEAEIDSAFAKHYGTVATGSPKWEGRPSALSKDTREAAKPPAAAPARRTPTLKEAREEAEAPYSYAMMSRALVSTISLLVQEQAARDGADMNVVRDRVRYCQLLATRLKLRPDECDGTIVAAWLSAYAANLPKVLPRLVCPYPLQEIFATPVEGATRRRRESLILGLVSAYQEMRASEPAAAADIDQVRRHLTRYWSSSAEGDTVLEVFLQVLMDEEFLTQAGRAAGRVLIVDPAEAAHETLSPPLLRDGYRTEVATSAAIARQMLAASPPDLIIADFNLPDEDGFAFCRFVRRNPATAHLPMILLATENAQQNETQALRAGADEFLPRPVNLELLFLKIARLVDRRPGADPQAGVKGSLLDMSFTDLIQILCAGGKSTHIILNREDAEAHVYIEHGNIVHVACGGSEGEAAFYDLMKWDAGEFRTQSCLEFPARTIHAPAMSLLMEGARLHDEGASP